MTDTQQITDRIIKAYITSADVLVTHNEGTQKSRIFSDLCNTIFRGKCILFIMPTLSEKDRYREGCSRFVNFGADIDFRTYKYFCDENRAINATFKYDVIVFNNAENLPGTVNGLMALRAFDIIRSSSGKYILGFSCSDASENTGLDQIFSATVTDNVPASDTDIRQEAM